MARAVGLMGAPTSAGAHGVGQEKAPLYLRRAGLRERLTGVGLDVVDLGDLPLSLFRARGSDPQRRNIDSVVDVALRVAERADEALQRGLLPFVLGGDCTITLGVLAGLQRDVGGLGACLFRRRRGP